MNLQILKDKFRELGDYALSRMVVAGFSTIIYLIASTENLQVIATFDDLVGPWERIISTAMVAFGSIVLFSMRPDVRKRYWVIPETILYVAPTAIIAFLPPWTGGGAIGAGVLVALQIVAFFYMSLRTRWSAPDYVLKVGGAVLGTFVVTYAFFTWSPVGLSRAMGAPMVVMLFITQLTVGIAVLARWPRWLFAAFVWVLASMVIYEFQHEAEYQPMRPYAGSDHGDADAFALWLFDRNDTAYFRKNKLPYPVVLIASEGGGGYAMAHSFTFMSKMSERCSNFSHHVFAMVGVSGGQVGNSLFHANMKKSAQSDLKPCAKSAPTRHTDYLSTDHLTPLLSKLLFIEIPRKLLFLGASERGRTLTLLDSLNVAPKPYNPIAKAPYWDHFWRFDDKHDFFAYKLRQKPALVSVTSNVKTGNRFIFTPFQFQTRAQNNIEFFRYSGDVKNIDQRLIGPTLGSVTMASASFPWVTPSLRFSTERAFKKYLDNPDDATEDQWKDDGPIRRRAVNLVDGGYVDNSGAETLSEIVASFMNEEAPPSELSCSTDEGKTWQGVDNDYRAQAFKHLGVSPCEEKVGCVELKARPVKTLSNDIKWGQCEVPFFPVAILIRDTVKNAEVAEQQTFLLDPIKTMLRARSARSDLTVSLLEERRCGFGEKSACWLSADTVGSGDPNPQIYNGVFQSLIDSGSIGLPLGWDIPRQKIETIERLVAPDDSLCAPLEDDIGAISFRGPNGKSITDPQDKLLRRNCSHIRQIVKYFDAGAIKDALDFRP